MRACLSDGTDELVLSEVEARAATTAVQQARKRDEEASAQVLTESAGERQQGQCAWEGAEEDREQPEQEQESERPVVWSSDEATITEPTFSAFVRTDEILTPAIRKLTHIKQDEVDGADDFPTVWAATLAWMRKAREEVSPDAIVILGHNLKPFDLPLLTHQGRTNDIDVFATLADLGVDAVIDSLDISKVYLRATVDGRRAHPDYNPVKQSDPNKDSNSQSDIYQHLFQCAMPNAHTALGDVTGLMKIVQSLVFSLVIGHHSASIAITLAQHEVRVRVLLEKWTAAQGGYGRDDRPRCERIDGHHLARTISNIPSATTLQRKFYCSRTNQAHPDDLERNCGCAYSQIRSVLRPGYTPPEVSGGRKQKPTGRAHACVCTTQCGSRSCPCYPGLCGPACHMGLGAGAAKCTNSTKGRAAKAVAKAQRQEAAKAAKAKAAEAVEASGAAMPAASAASAATAARADIE